MSKKKHDARQNAAENMVEREHLSETPSLPLSEQKLSQERFPGETPLTGEDRPTHGAGGKQEGLNPAHDRHLHPQNAEEPQGDR